MLVLIKGENHMFRIVLMLFAVVYASVADHTDSAIFTQSYTSLSEVNNSIRASRLVDDFIPEYSGGIQSIRVWVVYEGARPDSMYVGIHEDNGSVNPNTATLLTSAVLPAVHVNTGDFYGGYIVETTCTFPAVVPVSDSKTYWLEVRPGNGYLIARNPLVFGSTMWGYQTGQYKSVEVLLGKAYDSFFELYTSSVLARNSWGLIKVSF
jgi:hypothetical protein